MDLKKLSRILTRGGLAIVALAVVWFLAVFASLASQIGGLGGDRYVAKFLTCVYSSPAICQGINFASDLPAYTPVVFWIGAIAVLAGMILRFTLAPPAPGSALSGSALSDKALSSDAASSSGMSSNGLSSDAPSAGDQTAASVSAGGLASSAADGSLMGFIPAQRYVTIVYIVLLISLVVGPLVLGAGLVMGLLGLSVFKPRLSALDSNHLAAICAVSAGTLILLLVVGPGVFWLLLILVQLVLYYVGFNSYRNGRPVGLGNLGEEVRFALKPAVERLSARARN